MPAARVRRLVSPTPCSANQATTRPSSSSRAVAPGGAGWLLGAAAVAGSGGPGLPAGGSDASGTGRRLSGLRGAVECRRLAGHVIQALAAEGEADERGQEPGPLDGEPDGGAAVRAG